MEDSFKGVHQPDKHHNLFGYFKTSGVDRNKVEWNEVERVEWNIDSIVWVFYSIMEQTFHPIVWKIDGME